MDKFEFIPNEEICSRIYNKALELFTMADEDWDKIPEWAAYVMDGYIPYSTKSHNGSIFHALGFSCVSQDAHLRNLLEIVEGRETKELDFPIIVDKKVVAKRAGLE